jgi:hypothetical protein
MGKLLFLGDEWEERRETCVSASADFREHSEFREVEVRNQNLERATIYVLSQLAQASILSYIIGFDTGFEKAIAWLASRFRSMECSLILLNSKRAWGHRP